ncbi:MMPL family transporter [Candidatus Nanohalococcus occultus]|uniref:MMPL family transporter n=1 Tax=Candidatus Nanohalococcus occultus TaxID=2978047 RepID=UPI0039DFB3DC
MNGKLENGIRKYAETLSNRPGTVLLVAMIITGIIAAGASRVQTEQQGQEDLLPDSMPSIAAFEVINAEFSGTAGGTSYTILVEADPSHPNSTEVRDLRDPRALRYMETVSNDLRSMDKVSTVSSPSSLFADIPSDQRGVEDTLETLGESRWSGQISTDYQYAQIQVSTVGLNTDEQMEMAQVIRQAVETKERPAGLEMSYTGSPYIDEAFQAQTQQTMSLTGIVALLGVTLTVIILFRSIFYGLNSLLTLIFGVVAGFGLFGWLGLNMSPATSGALTMGIGVAIDFGIQPISRYIEERENLDIKKSVSETIQGVITPMTIGLIAANIGFMSLSVGRVTFLSDLGVLLTLTTTLAYVSAFTVIPSSLVLYDRYFTGDNGRGLKLPEINIKGDNQQ